MSDGGERRFDVFLTAQEAYPAFEREVLSARRQIEAGFRIFDPWTQLHSAEGRAIGDTWFDLIVHTLNRGVSLSLVLTDFDPVVRTDDHRYTWQCLRGLVAAGEASRRPDLLDVSVSMHPARAGFLPRLLLWPRLVKEITKSLGPVNTAPLQHRRAFWNTVPGLHPYLKWSGDVLKARKRPPQAVLVTHHQKLAVFDERLLYIGGLDLNDRRFDTPEHDRAADETWHDVQVMVDGPIAKEAATHLRTFRRVTAGAMPAATSHLLRTVSRKRRSGILHLSPKPVLDEIAQAHVDQIDRAERFIYLETQFFRDRRLAEALAARARRCPDLSLIVVLPAAPEDAAFLGNAGADVAYGEKLQTDCIGIVKEAFGNRMFAGSPAQPRATDETGRAVLLGAPIIYLHAKVSIFDGTTAIVSSANLNGRSMAWDTEVGLRTSSPREAEVLMQRCACEWIGEDAGKQYISPDTACAAWTARARENAALPPAARSGFILPYPVAPAEEVASSLPGVPEEMV